MRRLALAALVVAAGSARAEEPPEPVQKALNAMAAGAYIDRFCPAYRPNIAMIGSALVEAGVTKDQLATKYADFLYKTADMLMSHDGIKDDRFCDFLYDTYHTEGDGPSAIEKR